MKFDTGYCADSVEFCPHPDARDIFVCGTYQLLEPAVQGGSQLETDNEADIEIAGIGVQQKRIGKYFVYKASQDSESPEDIELLEETETAAILDMKWSFAHSVSGPLLGIVDAEGRIELHRWIIQERCMQRVCSLAIRPSNCLCLSLDWENRRNPNALGSLIVSCSDGSLSLVKVADESTITEERTWHAHDYEPWIAAWNYWDSSVVYSGGDDLKLKGWDIRQATPLPIFTNKSFDAGITSIQSHPYVEHIFAVGSYDSTVRLFDSRKPLVPIVQAAVGGGAWRVKWHPEQNRSSDLLVACMHDGFKVLRFSPSVLGQGHADGEENWRVTTKFDKHESLAYGVDWSHVGNGTGDHQTMVASCSFYDHTLHTWRG